MHLMLDIIAYFIAAVGVSVFLHTLWEELKFYWRSRKDDMNKPSRF